MVVCPIKAKPVFEGISEEQKYKLKRGGNRGATPQQQWFGIWDILFPSEPRPTSIYLGNFMEETLSYIGNRCQNEVDSPPGETPRRGCRAWERRCDCHSEFVSLNHRYHAGRLRVQNS